MDEYIPNNGEQAEAQPSLEDINQFMTGTYAYGDSQNPLAPAVDSMRRESAIQQLMDGGIEEFDAIASVETVEASGAADIEREMLYMVHGNTAEKAGLAVSGGHHATVLVRDGMTFDHALQAAEGQPTPELATNLQRLASNYLHSAQSYGVRSHDTEVSAILREAKPDWWMDGHDTPADEIHSIDEITANAGSLSQRFEEQGVDPVTADYVRNTATFIREGDLVPWATAGEFGLLPETAHSDKGVLDPNAVWLGWESEQDWEPAFRILAEARPDGQFREYFRAQLISDAGQLAQQHHATLNESFEDYKIRDAELDKAIRADEREVFEDEFDDDAGFVESDEEKQLRYENGRTWSEQQLPALLAVQARLASTAASS